MTPKQLETMTVEQGALYGAALAALCHDIIPCDRLLPALERLDREVAAMVRPIARGQCTTPGCECGAVEAVR